jgi:FAD/FMN-containing dehydrogenase
LRQCRRRGDCHRVCGRRAAARRVRGGSHNIAGNATCNDGLVIDLAGLKRIEVEREARRSRAGGGVNWGELDAATQGYGLATTGGLMPSTGIAGFTLGGGLGHLMRSYGLACDNLVSAEVVTADGSHLRADAEHHPDLFWALRGGGGNFGVVTAFEFKLHDVGPELLAGRLVHPLVHARDALQFASKLHRFTGRLRITERQPRRSDREQSPHGLAPPM